MAAIQTWIDHHHLICSLQTMSQKDISSSPYQNKSFPDSSTRVPSQVKSRQNHIRNKTFSDTINLPCHSHSHNHYMLMSFCKFVYGGMFSIPSNAARARHLCFPMMCQGYIPCMLSYVVRSDVKQGNRCMLTR